MPPVSTRSESSIPFDLDRPAGLAPGTALYGLEPVGLGTPQRESLRGYLVRLAVEHCVRPREMVARVLAELEPDIARWTYASFFARHALTIDGAGHYAGVFVRALGAATGRKDLATLSMLPWSSLFPSNGQALLARQPRWCPECLREGALASGGAHWQLRWSLVAVDRCTEHSVALQDRCAHCGKSQPAIPRHPQIGWCDHCLSPLFDIADGDLASASFGTDAWGDGALYIDQLVAVQGDLICEPRERWLAFVEHAVQALGQGERAALCRKMGLQPRALNAWLRRKDRVSLEAVIRVCSALQRSADEVFGAASVPAPAQNTAPMRGGQLTRHGPEIRLRAAGFLSEALRQDMPPSLREVAAAAGVSRGFLRYWFGKQAAQLTGRRRSIMAQWREERAVQRTAQVEAAVLELVGQGKFPGRKLVESAVRRRGFSLLDAGMLEAYRAVICRPGLLRS